MRLYDTVPSLVIVAGVYISLLAALFSIRAFRTEFELVEPEHRNPFDVIPGRSARALGTLAMHVPPLALGGTWIWLLVAGA